MERVQSDLDFNSRIKKADKEELNDEYIILYHENRRSDSVEVTLLPN